MTKGRAHAARLLIRESRTERATGSKDISVVQQVAIEGCRGGGVFWEWSCTYWRPLGVGWGWWLVELGVVVIVTAVKAAALDLCLLQRKQGDLKANTSEEDESRLSRSQRVILTKGREEVEWKEEMRGGHRKYQERGSKHFSTPWSPRHLDQLRFNVLSSQTSSVDFSVSAWYFLLSSASLATTAAATTVSMAAFNLLLWEQVQPLMVLRDEASPRACPWVFGVWLGATLGFLGLL
ncbi:hypothetical protein EDB89DRAFT_2243136 [Lactarius sanguifluus]|nr:hypothetical protein EDB89DRAFT_2243136 [Lactarius sanguifluus]